MARYPDNFIDELLERSDLVELISEYTRLTHRGGRYWGLCPFHNEKTPSFSVQPEKRMYYCHGCHEGGTAIQFVMAQERMTFGEAVRHLAERAHMTLPNVDAHKDALERGERERLLAANRSAARFFHAQIWTPNGQEALAYLRRRGLSDSVIKRFGLGASPPGWDGLIKELGAQGFTPDELVRAGLVVDRDGRRYDMFRNRAMFPVIDARGHVIAFGARALGDVQPKYLNSSETLLFRKRSNLYGLNFVKRGRNDGRLYLVEGYMDVVSLSRFGIEGCVATLGTAITAEQAKLMTRYAAEVIVAYDGDEAGQNAARKAIDLLEEANLKARVLRIPGGMDPDEYVQKEGAASFEALETEDAVSFRLTRAAMAYDVASQEGRTQYAMDACQILRRVPNAVERENYLKRLVVETGFERDVLLAQIGQAERTAPSARRNEDGRNRHTMGNHVLPHEEAQRLLIAALVADPARVGQVVRAEDFDDPACRDAAQVLLSGGTVAQMLAGIENDAFRGRLAEALQKPIAADETLPDMVEAWLGQIRLARIEGEIVSLTGEIQQQGRPDPELVKKLMVLSQEKERLKRASRKE